MEIDKPDVFFVGKHTRIAFDIGGVISKYPREFHHLMLRLKYSDFEIHIITDQCDRQEVLAQLSDNGFGFIPASNVHCADYALYGEMCKAILLRDLKIQFS